MKDSKRYLYFIAILPPVEIREEVESIKRYFADTYRSRHALKSPPHITLLMPFRWQNEREEELTGFLKKFASAYPPLSVSLKDFGAFPRRVIYIDVEKNNAMENLFSDLTEQISANLKIIKDTYKNKGFTAHMTIAHRDLKPAAFREAWPEFKEREFRAEFIADKLGLLKHNGKRWEILEEFPFQLKGRGT